MIEAALAGAVAGYAIAIPVGAIAVLIIHTGLTEGLRGGAAAAAGAATADLIYATIAALAGLGVAAMLGPWLVPLRLVGGMILVAFGVRGLLTARSARESIDPATAHHRQQRSHARTYVALLGLTLLNPATIIYFTALAVGLPFLGGIAERLVFATTAFAASLSWQLLLAVFGATLGRRSGDRLRRATVYFGNGVVIVLGLAIVVGGLQPPA